MRRPGLRLTLQANSTVVRLTSSGRSPATGSRCSVYGPQWTLHAPAVRLRRGSGSRQKEALHAADSPGWMTELMRGRQAARKAACQLLGLRRSGPDRAPGAPPGTTGGHAWPRPMTRPSCPAAKCALTADGGCFFVLAGRRVHLRPRSEPAQEFCDRQAFLSLLLAGESAKSVTPSRTCPGDHVAG